MFDADLKRGAIGERVAWDILNSQPNIRTVLDVRQASMFQNMDVDFLVEKTDREIFLVEVKTDNAISRTGNVVYELTTSGNIGCFAKTKAQIVMYYDVEGIMYAIDVKHLREYISHNRFDAVRMGDNATGYLISIEELKVNKIIFKEWRVKE